jgi:3',5'-cyclic AMP phosphodiesterase CpdA
MSRLWIFSDLHQDWADNAWDPTAHAPTFDVAVVAGDVHSPLTKAIDWLGDRLAGAPVIYVPGNHDFWCGADSADRYTRRPTFAGARPVGASRRPFAGRRRPCIGRRQVPRIDAVDRPATRHLVAEGRRTLSGALDE